MKTNPSSSTHRTPLAPADLPGNGLAHHDFFYAGEAKDRRMYIVRNSQIVWSYDDPSGRGEISDAVLMSNGNVVLAHQYAVKMIAPDQSVIWNYDAPPETEIHTAQPIGQDHVVFVQNGHAPILKVADIKKNKVVIEFSLAVKKPQEIHGQFRNARLTEAGTILVGHMDLAKVIEYDIDGREQWSFTSDSVWGVEPLSNGNVLITGRLGTREITRAGETVWSYTEDDVPDYKQLSPQKAWRLPNGNTLVNNWFNQWGDAIDKTNPPVQAFELTPDKRVVWALRSWDAPDLGPSTTIQVLDEPTAPETVRFGDIG